MEKVKIEVSAGNTTTLLTGEALKQMPPEKILLTGDIKAVNTFLLVRQKSAGGTQQPDKGRSVILVDKKSLTITLNVDPENHYGATVLARLEESDELVPFGINTLKTFTKKELVKLIKFNKLYFESAEKHSEMLLAFQKISSEVNIKANDSSDDRGNKENAFVKEVTTNAPTDFMLNIPIFKGFPSSTFKVEVCLDVNEGSARFWFESVDLHNIKTETIDTIFKEQLSNADGFVIINK